MSSIERSGFNSFTRGGQFLNHFLRMAKDNLVRYVMVALLVAGPFAYLRYETAFDRHDRYVLVSEAVMIATTTIAPDTDRKYVLQRADGSERTVRMKDRYDDPIWASDVDQMWTDAKSVLWILAIVGGTVILLISLVAAGVGKALATDKHQRGARMDRARDVAKTIRQHNAHLARKIGGAFKEHVPYEIVGVPYPMKAETQHTALVGSTGSGKSQLLATVLEQIAERNGRLIAYDKMRSFIRRFYRPGKDIILNAFDARCPYWDIFADARNLADWQDIAAAMIPDPGGANSFFYSSAQTVFAHTANTYVRYCKSGQRYVAKSQADMDREEMETGRAIPGRKVSPPSDMPITPTLEGLLDVVLRSTHHELKAYLAGTMAAGAIDPANERTTASIRSTISDGLTSLGYLPRKSDNRPVFSIREWVRNEETVDDLGRAVRRYDKTRVFMTSREDRHTILMPLITTWVTIFNSALMSRERADAELIWMLLDELPSLNEVPGIERALAEARQYEVAYLIGLQLVSQLRDIYGRDRADSIMGLTRSKVIFNPGDPITAEVMSKFIGSRETLRREHSISIGANSLRDGQGVASRVQTEAIVLPEELAQLEPLNGILSMTGNFSACKIQLTYQSLDVGEVEGLAYDDEADTRCETIFTEERLADDGRHEAHGPSDGQAEDLVNVDSPTSMALHRPQGMPEVRYGTPSQQTVVGYAPVDLGSSSVNDRASVDASRVPTTHLQPTRLPEGAKRLEHGRQRSRMGAAAFEALSAETVPKRWKEPPRLPAADVFSITPQHKRVALRPVRESGPVT